MQTETKNFSWCNPKNINKFFPKFFVLFLSKRKFCYFSMFCFGILYLMLCMHHNSVHIFYHSNVNTCFFSLSVSLENFTSMNAKKWIEIYVTFDIFFTLLLVRRLRRSEDLFSAFFYFVFHRMFRYQINVQLECLNSKWPLSTNLWIASYRKHSKWRRKVKNIKLKQ